MPSANLVSALSAYMKPKEAIGIVNTTDREFKDKNTPSKLREEGVRLSRESTDTLTDYLNTNFTAINRLQTNNNKKYYANKQRKKDGKIESIGVEMSEDLKINSDEYDEIWRMVKKARCRASAS